MLKLLRAALTSGGGNLVALLLGAGATKILALTLGPFGVGFYALLQQALGIATTIGTVSGASAVTQGLASREGEERRVYLATGFWLTVCGVALAALGLLVLAPWVAAALFQGADAATVAALRWLALVVVLTTLASFMNALLQTSRAIGALAVNQILQTGTRAAVIWPLALAILALAGPMTGHPLYAALLGLPAAASLLHALWVARGLGWWAELRLALPRGLEGAAVRHFLAVSATGLASGLMTSFCQMGVQALAVEQGGVQAAGMLAAAWTVSMTYMTIALGALATYYFPALAEAGRTGAGAELMSDVARFIVATGIPAVTAAILLKPLVIRGLYAEEFLGALSVLRWMLIADYFKALSWVLAMPMLAHADLRQLLIADAVWNAILLGGAALTLRGFGPIAGIGIEGIGIAFLAAYVVYAGFAVYYVRTHTAFTLGRRTVTTWAGGLGLIGAASWWSWSATVVAPLDAALWIAGASLFGWFALTPGDRAQLVGLVRRRT
jgi:O-antigen/teichoic acid export membrane protein